MRGDGNHLNLVGKDPKIISANIEYVYQKVNSHLPIISVLIGLSSAGISLETPGRQKKWSPIHIIN